MKNSCSLLKFKTLVNAVHGKVVESSLNIKHIFSNVVTDSRLVVKQSLFVPLIGQEQDGHKYISQAIEKGASIILVARIYFDSHKNIIEELSEKNIITFIIVENTLTALQNIAESYVAQFPNLIRVAITGSSGKTTTKEIAVSLLSQKYRVIANEGNLNSETGLPLSVFKIRSDHQIGIFEMGMNRKNEIKEISQILKPQYAIITNIGTAHIGILGSKKNIAIEKRQVLRFLNNDGAAVLPKNDEYSSFLAENLNCKINYFGMDIPSDENGIKFLKDEGIKGFLLAIDGIETKFSLPGKYNYINALAAIELARIFKIPTKQIVSGLTAVQPLSGRTEINELKINEKKINIIQDCYNANPDAMAKAIDFLSSLKCTGRKFCILGDMLELGTESIKMHSNIGKQLIDTDIKYAVFVGSDMKYAFNEASLHNKKDLYLQYFSDITELTMNIIANYIVTKVENSDVILFKGSRGIKLERIIKKIESGQQEKNNEYL